MNRSALNQTNNVCVWDAFGSFWCESAGTFCDKVSLYPSIEQFAQQQQQQPPPRKIERFEQEEEKQDKKETFASLLPSPGPASMWRRGGGGPALGPAPFLQKGGGGKEGFCGCGADLPN
jgi:hypothetical protein